MEKAVFAADALAGRVVLVTGASRGIGAGILEAFLKAGATVVGSATSEAGAEKITARIAELGGQGRGVVLNVNDADAGQKAVADVVEAYGRIDVLVNNAGITRDTLAMRMKDEQWDDVIDTDLSAAFRFARACLRPMMKQRSGRIISITSVVGAMGNPGQVNYAAAKAGLMGMTKALAREIGSRRHDARPFGRTEGSSAGADSARPSRFGRRHRAELPFPRVRRRCLHHGGHASCERRNVHGLIPLPLGEPF